MRGKFSRGASKVCGEWGGEASALASCGRDWQKRKQLHRVKASQAKAIQKVLCLFHVLLFEKLSFITNLNSLELSCLATVSNQVIGRKIEQEGKKWKIEGRGRGGENRKRFLLSSPPSPLRFLFCALVPTFSSNSRRNACYTGQFGTYI